MRGDLRRWAWGLAGVVGVIVVAVVVFRFPWERTIAALAGVNIGLLAIAALINLLSPLAKGWAWHLLLAPVAPHRWWAAQEANLIGTAVNSVTAGVTGEAARVSIIGRRDGVPLRAAVLSVIWSRAVETMGLALFLVLAPFVLDLPAPLRGLQIGAGLALVAVLLLARFRGWSELIERLPGSLRPAATELALMSATGRLIAPTALALCSWAAEWATFHLTLRAVHLPVSYAASFTALIAVNVGGMVRITPGNVGVLQAAMVGALLPFGIDADQALAGAFALQGIEVLPILALAIPLAGRAGLSALITGAEIREPS